MKSFSPIRALTTLCVLGRNVLPAQAIDLNPDDPSSIRSAAKSVAEGLVGMYANINGDQTNVLSGIPGLLTYPPYYWWEAGAMFGQLIDYWYYTNDSTYNDMVREGMLFQIGDQMNYMPANQSKDEGNDDQLFWAFSVMSAAELGFPNPSSDKPGWLALAQSVMNQLNDRWDTQTCNGGLRWQIYQYIAGYNYKNTAANGGMFQLGARLAKYTGNKTYADWAERSFDWLAQSPLLPGDGQVYDGTDVLKQCSSPDRTPWTYNYGIMIGGSAYMYSYTNGSQVWADRLTKFIAQAQQKFFPQAQGNGTVMVEICEQSQKCNVDQWSFKAYLSRWLAISAQLAPFTKPTIMPMLQKSAQAAALTCTGGDNKNICGSRWYMDQFDSSQGVGQQMSALSVISANLISEVKPPYSADSGGTSQGNPSLGTGGDGKPAGIEFDEVTMADKAGAGILTALALIATVGGGLWLSF
ncbi:glycoside hydrolase family 76 protein [Lophiostoma macrostomum CBS 122681]|uniref:Mannan endo-1,6-alpha-mannosidase n=1 Tax=Lophiostoma macrostomum CBS 122681 TaxID=1314788 RepID=A0A6A6T9G4_9PLEO|nr:glycoside hydrolase family 76 protein [Lophiostoma macrostomum CBS 122681]